MIKHISFDLWGTLIKGSPQYEERLVDILTKYITLTFREDIKNVQEGIEDTIQYIRHCNLLTGGTVGPEHRVYVLLDRLGVQYKNIERRHIYRVIKIFQDCFKEVSPVFINKPELNNILALCFRRDISVSILSNTGFITGAEFMLFLGREGMRDKFKFHLFSDEIKASKPSSRAFMQLIVRCHELELDEILHVGDSKVQDGGCETYGMRFLHVYGDSGIGIEALYDLIT